MNHIHNYLNRVRIEPKIPPFARIIRTNVWSLSNPSHFSILQQFSESSILKQTTYTNTAPVCNYLIYHKFISIPIKTLSNFSQRYRISICEKSKSKYSAVIHLSTAFFHQFQTDQTLNIL